MIGSELAVLATRFFFFLQEVSWWSYVLFWDVSSDMLAEWRVGQSLGFSISINSHGMQFPRGASFRTP